MRHSLDAFGESKQSGDSVNAVSAPEVADGRGIAGADYLLPTRLPAHEYLSSIVFPDTLYTRLARVMNGI